MKKGLTLVEALVVTVLFTALFSAILSVMISSDRSWRIGQEKLTTQSQARAAMDSISRLLRQSNPDWVIGGTHYQVLITDGNRIDFYVPEFDDDGAITALKKVTYKPSIFDSTRLLKKEGTDPYTTVATSLDSINFGGGCAGCSAFNCATAAEDCPVVDIQVTTRSNSTFTLTSRIELRNRTVTLPDDVELEQPEEGEF